MINRMLHTLLFLLFIGSIRANEPADTLLVAYTSAPPFIILNEGAEPEGISIWLWKEIAAELNLTYELVPMGFGEMLDSLSTGAVDVSINPLSITSNRSKKMGFTMPFYAANGTVAQMEISGFHRFVDFVASFFNLNFLRVILGLFLLIGAFGLTVWGLERKKNPYQFRPGAKGIWDGLWWSAVTMTTVGYGDKSPKSRGGKIIALIWMFSGIIFISGFTASIASSLTSTHIHENADELNDFKERSIGCINSSSMLDFLKGQFFRNIRSYDNLTESLNALKEGEIEAFLFDEPILKYRLKVDAEFQKIQLLPIKYNPQFYAFGMAKEREAIRYAASHHIIELIESRDWEMVLQEYALGDW